MERKRLKEPVKRKRLQKPFVYNGRWSRPALPACLTDLLRTSAEPDLEKLRKDRAGLLLRAYDQGRLPVALMYALDSLFEHGRHETVQQIERRLRQLRVPAGNPG